MPNRKLNSFVYRAQRHLACADESASNKQYSIGMTDTVGRDELNDDVKACAAD